MKELENNAVDTRAATIEGDIVLPSQFYAPGCTAELQPEKRLMLAVLEDAVATFQKYALAEGGRERELLVETEAWILSTDLEWPFSFGNICLALDLDAGTMRRGLSDWRERRRQGLLAAITTSPFRRVGGSRHKATGHAPGLGKRAA